MSSEASSADVKRGRVLVVDDDLIECRSLSEFLKLDGYEVDSATSGGEAIDKLNQNSFDVVLTDVNMPEITGFDLLNEVNKNHDDTAVILITGYGQIEGAVRAIKEGAYDYITKPLIDDGVKMIINRALEQQRLKKENVQLRKQLGLLSGSGDIIGRSHQMRKLQELIESVADSRATVMITGESGVGKTLVARSVHSRSPRKGKPFIEVSCGSLPESLLESELFGHARGSFTGAVGDKEGKFQVANGGTVFLDEIGDAPLSMQIKLLRVIQDRVFERVGDNKTVQADVRLIVATNKSLEDEVKAGRFREDLFYRIKVVTLNIPPLRERLGDLKPLAEHFLRKYAAENGKEVLGISEPAMAVMQKHAWPGNVRELENCIERSVILCRGEEIAPDDLPFVSRSDGRVFVPQASGTVIPLKMALEQPEREVLLAALERFKWSRSDTAEALDINRSTLFKKMKKYGLEPPEGLAPEEVADVEE
jgi:DNA-binding NtrC family response regulator